MARRPKSKAPRLPAYVRTGGLVGDESMQLMEDFNAGGAGVDESRVRHCGPDPNDDLNDGMPSLPGAEG